MKASRASLLMLHLILFCLLAIPRGYSQSRTDIHYLYHSVFIYNFCKYIQWPEDNRLHIIGVLGDSPILQGLYRMARAKSSPYMRFIIRKYENIEDIESNCHILFIPNTFALTPYRKAKLLQKIAGMPLLVLTENEEYIQEFSSINFIVKDSKLIFQINPQNIEKTGLKVSYQLLRLGIIVQNK
jgi:hypothetical protein